MRLKKMTALGLAAVMGLSITACGGGNSAGNGGGAPAETTQAAAAETTAEALPEGVADTVSTRISRGDVAALEQEMVVSTHSSKDTLNVQLSGDPGTLFPYTKGAGNVTEIINREVCEPLFFHGYNFEIVPLLATSWEHPDELTYIFHLREGVKYSDGTDFVADDVKFSMQMNYDDTQLQQNVKSVDMDNVEIIDDYTIKIPLKEPDAYFMTELQGVAITKEETYKNSPDGFTEKPIGTGAYYVDEFVGGNRAVLKANPNYWGGEPAIKTVTFKVISDTAQRSIALETGEVDLLTELSQQDYSRIEADDRFNTIIRSGYKSDTLDFNCSENSICHDVKVRQAIAYAIDKAAIYAAVYQNKFGSIATAYPSDGMIDYDPKWEEGGYYATDLEKSKALLKEAGIAEGTKITIINNGDKTYSSVAEIVQAMLSQVGLNAEITSYERAVYNSIMDDAAGGWDIAFGSKTSPAGYVADMAHAYFEKAGINRCHYTNDEFNEWLLEAKKTEDDSKRAEITDKIVKVLQEDVPSLAFHRQAINYAWVKDLKGFNVYGQNNIRVKYLYFE